MSGKFKPPSPRLPIRASYFIFETPPFHRKLHIICLISFTNPEGISDIQHTYNNFGMAKVFKITVFPYIDKVLHRHKFNTILKLFFTLSKFCSFCKALL